MENGWKAYKPIICNENPHLRFMKTDSGKLCNFCGEGFSKNEGILTIDYIINLHFECIDKFLKSIKKFKKDKLKEIILDKL
jgi:hypothetical protein